ncbi:hypothetical protein [Geodermatophilus chilensis]|uniref:hypothetical protein n=1 Tax=Geodermatophilus chilensis TaxID=2035835 RepID=UPI001E59CD53|nr:hypothetical protein [Geodermatophilus chilensis]
MTSGRRGAPAADAVRGVRRTARFGSGRLPAPEREPAGTGRDAAPDSGRPVARRRPDLSLIHT